MTVGTALSDEPVQTELPIPMSEVPSDVYPEEEVSSAASATDAEDADILRGLGALADLVTNASETLNQCLLTIEGKLSAASVAREEWVPIQAARSAIECVAAPDDRKRTQERIFGGVPVMILQMSAPTMLQQPAKRCEWQYELGYAVADQDWALMLRTSSFDSSTERDGSSEFSGLIPLREAPLEIKLKAIRELPRLFKVLDVGALDGATAIAIDRDVQEDAAPIAQAEEQAASSAH
jgi:hypothetical protein